MIFRSGISEDKINQLHDEIETNMAVFMTKKELLQFFKPPDPTDYPTPFGYELIKIEVSRRRKHRHEVVKTAIIRKRLELYGIESTKASRHKYVYYKAGDLKRVMKYRKNRFTKKRLKELEEEYE